MQVSSASFRPRRPCRHPVGQSWYEGHCCQFRRWIIRRRRLCEAFRPTAPCLQMPGCSGVDYTVEKLAWDCGYDLDPEEQNVCGICNVGTTGLESLVAYRDIVLHLDSGRHVSRLPSEGKLGSSAVAVRKLCIDAASAVNVFTIDGVWACCSSRCDVMFSPRNFCGMTSPHASRVKLGLTVRGEERPQRKGTDRLDVLRAMTPRRLCKWSRCFVADAVSVDDTYVPTYIPREERDLTRDKKPIRQHYSARWTRD